MNLLSEWCGPNSYTSGQIMQNKWAELVQEGSKPIVLGFEFEPVITIGKRGKAVEDLKVGMESARQQGWEVVCVDRGGHATLHSRGQVVIYPIVSLRAWRWGARKYICWLLKSTHSCLESFGIESFEGDEPGLYTSEGKIAFFGVRISRGITQHGLSVNISNDLDAFSLIRSCGKAMETFDRVQNHMPETTAEIFFQRWKVKAEEKWWRY